MTRQLYADPISTTSRGVLLYLAEHPAAIEVCAVSLMDGQHQTPDFAAVNPNKCVPALADGDFILTEASAILKYLAELEGSPAYPSDLKARARVNQAMDWLNTGFYRDFGYGMIYLQAFPHHVYENPQTQADVLARAKDKAGFWLKVLDTHYLPGQPYLCGKEPTIADYLGAAYVSIGDWIGFDLTPYPNVERWMKTMRARPSWAEVNGAFDGLSAYFRGKLMQPA